MKKYGEINLDVRFVVLDVIRLDQLI